MNMSFSLLYKTKSPYRAKREDNGKWVVGYVTRVGRRDENEVPQTYYFNAVDALGWSSEVVVTADSICRNSDTEDRNKCDIYEGDIVVYNTSPNYPQYGLQCTGIVKYGHFMQDGSEGEYGPTECIGFYVEVMKHELPKESYLIESENCLPGHMRQQNINFVSKKCTIVGNIYDGMNPEEERMSITEALARLRIHEETRLSPPTRAALEVAIKVLEERERGIL